MKLYSDWFRVGPRASGRTTAIAEACIKINATMLCATQRDAYRITKEYGIKAVSIQYQPSVGLRGPFLADHFAISAMLHDYENEIHNLKRENRKLKENAVRNNNE